MQVIPSIRALAVLEGGAAREGKRQIRAKLIGNCATGNTEADIHQPARPAARSRCTAPAAP